MLLESKISSSKFLQSTLDSKQLGDADTEATPITAISWQLLAAAIDWLMMDNSPTG
jgi:hypothetical protein